jgi:hypothetical protein
MSSRWASVQERARPALATRSGRLGAYALWQLRDYLMEKGVGTTIVMLFAGSLTFVGVRASLASGQVPDNMARTMINQGFLSLLGMLVLLGVLFATNGIVSDDRKNGFYRFLFAKPVNVPRFYVQKFAVYGAGFLLVSLALVVTFNVVVGKYHPSGGPLPVFPATLFPVIALLFVGLGGIGFLMSAIWRVDWLSFMTVYIVASVAWDLFENDAGWKGTVVRAAPPMHKLSGIYRAVVMETTLPVDDLRWIVLYGLGCFVLGVFIVRRRALTTT